MLPRFLTASLFLFFISPSFAQDQAAPPDQTTQEKMLDQMRQYASQYVSNLPNFVCTQVTGQFEAGKKSDKWKQRDELTSRLTFSNGHEQRQLELVNGKKIEPGSRRWRTPLVTEGEFGILLSRIFGDESAASFEWSRWETFKGKQLAAFNFAIKKENSSLKLSLSDLASATVPYHGTVFADASTGQVWRITDTPTDIPKEIRTESIKTEINYDEITIGTIKYLLPVEAKVEMVTDHNKILNDLKFEGYRKFEAESTLTFGDEPPKP